MTQPRPSGGIIERLTNTLTAPFRRDPPSAALNLVKPQTMGVPPELLVAIRSRPFDPKLLDIYRPDPLARREGWGVYTEMMNDAQVHANLTIKRYGPISNGWTLTQKGQGTQAEEIRQFCEDNFNDLERTIEEIVGEGLESTFTGLSLGEMIWRVQKGGKYAGRLMLEDVQYRPPSVLDVKFDGTGRITGVVQLVRGVTPQNDPGFPPFKFVIHSYRARYGSPYGVGDARAVYKHWWAKDFLLRAWAVYMERYGSPSIVGRENENMSETDLDIFEDMLKAIQHQGYAILPAGWNFEWITAPGGAGNGTSFLEAIEWHDRAISKSILGSTMTTDQPSTGLGLGGGAVAAQHADTRDLIMAGVKRDAERLIVGRQLLRRMVYLNYGPEAAQEFTPSITFNPADLGDMKDLAGIIQQLITAGVVDPAEPWIRERLHVPAREESAEEVKKAKLDAAETAAKVQEISQPPQPPAAQQGEDES